jgi:hypothetical protein
LIISAAYGVIDDGKKFSAMRTVCVAKFFTVLVMYMCFNLSMTLPKELANYFGAGGGDGTLTYTLSEILIFLACLFGGYSMGQWLCSQIGDNSTTADTMKDMMAVKSGVSGASKLGGAALRLGKAAANPAAAIGTAALGAVTGHGLSSAAGKNVLKNAGASIKNAGAKIGNAAKDNIGLRTGNAFRSKE